MFNFDSFSALDSIQLWFTFLLRLIFSCAVTMCSVIEADGVKIQSAKHTFIKILQGKPVADDGSLSRAKALDALSQLAILVNHLLEQPEKIADAKLAIMSVRNVANLDNKKRKISLLDNDSDWFEQKSVKKLVQVPHQWLWQWLESRAYSCRFLQASLEGKMSRDS